mgnify:FL=1
MIFINVMHTESTYHTSFSLFSDEGVSENLGKFAGPEGQMCALPAQGADTLFEGEQGLVDFGALHPGLSVGRRGVRPALVTRQINQREFAKECFPVVVVAQHDLESSQFVRSGLFLPAYKMDDCRRKNEGVTTTRIFSTKKKEVKRG